MMAIQTKMIESATMGKVRMTLLLLIYNEHYDIC